MKTIYLLFLLLFGSILYSDNHFSVKDIDQIFIMKNEDIIFKLKDDIYFKGIESLDDILEMLIPEEWLKAEFEKHLTEEELKKINIILNLFLMEDQLMIKCTFILPKEY